MGGGHSSAVPPAKTCRFSISRRRGRCPHRPAGNGRFMAVFRRVRVDFPFRVVGADDPVRPRKTTVFTENRCEFATFLKGRCGHRPLRKAAKNQRISRADRVVRPYKGHKKPRRSGEKSPRLPFRTVAGRCGHRPLQITTKNQRISRADRAARPYKRDTIDRLYHRIPYIKYRPCRDISGARNRPILQTSGVFVKFMFHAVGVDAHIDPQEMGVLWRFSGESVLISHFAS